MLDLPMVMKDRHNLDGTDDWRLKYANAFDQFAKLNAAGDCVEPSPDAGSNFRDRNAWGYIEIVTQDIQ